MHDKGTSMNPNNLIFFLLSFQVLFTFTIRNKINNSNNNNLDTPLGLAQFGVSVI